MNSSFVIERTLNAPLAKVWAAISDKTEMKKWYFDLPDFQPKVGCKFQFSGGTEEKQYIHLCEVTEVAQGKKLTYSWRYEGYEGNSFVTFDLFDEGNNTTKLKLTHTGLETFPKSNPDLAKENFAMGWTELISTSLPNFLQSN